MTTLQSLKKYRHVIWTIAKTDFRLRYHGSVLGYVWTLLQPLLIFSIMYFVFSSVFARGASREYYALELLTGLTIFNFFTTATANVLTSLFGKKSLIKKIYLPLWTIIAAVTLNNALTFLMNMVVLITFFAILQFVPSIGGILYFVLTCVQIVLLILAFGLITAPLFPRFRDLKMIWQVLTRALLYGSPIIYPLSAMPENVQRILLLNPLAFIIHHVKQALIFHHYPEWWQSVIFNVAIIAVFCVSVLFYRHFSKTVTEDI